MEAVGVEYIWTVWWNILSQSREFYRWQEQLQNVYLQHCSNDTLCNFLLSLGNMWFIFELFSGNITPYSEYQKCILPLHSANPCPRALRKTTVKKMSEKKRCLDNPLVHSLFIPHTFMTCAWNRHSSRHSGNISEQNKDPWLFVQLIFLPYSDKNSKHNKQISKLHCTRERYKREW